MKGRRVENRRERVKRRQRNRKQSQREDPEEATDEREQRMNKILWEIRSPVFAAAILAAAAVLPAEARTVQAAEEEVEDSVQSQETGSGYSLTVVLESGGVVFPDTGVWICRAADLDEDTGACTALIGSYDYGSITTARENQDTAQELNSLITAWQNGDASEEIPESLEVLTAQTDENGEALFSDLEPGIYLAAQTDESGSACSFDPYLVWVPELTEDGYESDVVSSPKTLNSAVDAGTEELSDTETEDSAYTGDLEEGEDGISAGSAKTSDAARALLFTVFSAVCIFIAAAAVFRRKKSKS